MSLMGGGTIPDVQITELVLERSKVATQAAITPQVMHDLEVRTTMEVMTDRLLVQLQSYVLRHKVFSSDDEILLVGETTAVATAEVPRSPWQGFKSHRLFPWIVGTFWRKLWPVKTVAVETSTPIRLEKTIRAAEYATFPKNETVYPKSLGGAVRLQELSVDGLPHYADSREED